VSIDKIQIYKKMAREADRLVEWQQEVYTKLHNIDAEWIRRGRLSLSRMPDGPEGKVLMAQGFGLDPVWADPPTTNPNIIRYGRDVVPTWVIGSEVTAPSANTSLVSKTVSSGKSGYIYGFVVTAGEANDFRLNWVSGGSSKSIRFTLASKGTIVVISPTALNEGLPADGGSSITITNVNAGSSGVVYQVALLYAEV